LKTAATEAFYGVGLLELEVLATYYPRSWWPGTVVRTSVWCWRLLVMET
jgi:hypothetical protein